MSQNERAPPPAARPKGRPRKTPTFISPPPKKPAPPDPQVVALLKAAGIKPPPQPKKEKATTPRQPQSAFHFFYAWSMQASWTRNPLLSQIELYEVLYRQWQQMVEGDRISHTHDCDEFIAAEAEDLHRYEEEMTNYTEYPDDNDPNIQWTMTSAPCDEDGNRL